jgi:hypothetical protein
METKIKAIKYKITNANTDYGRLVVKFYNDDLPQGTYLEVDVPVDETTGEYVTGDVLSAAIMERAPLYVFRRAAVVASASNFELIERLVQIEDSGDIPLPADTLEELKDMSKQTLHKDLNLAIAVVNSPLRFTMVEQYKYGLIELPAFIQVEADIRCVDVEVVVAEALEMRDKLRQVFVILESKRIVAANDIDEAADAEELGFITYAYQLEVKNVMKYMLYGKEGLAK